MFYNIKNEFLRLKYRITALAGAVLLLAAIPLSLTSSHVYAYTTYGWCTVVQGYNACLNGWNNGPWVESYNSNDTNNSFFNNNAAPNGYVELVYEGFSGGQWVGKCIGDAYNDEFNYNTSLDNCPTSPGGAGWGTNFKEYSCYQNGNPGYEFWNKNWNAYMEPEATANGYPFNLSGSASCFVYTQFIL
jgi:hypothetical protein